MPRPRPSLVPFALVLAALVLAMPAAVRADEWGLGALRAAATTPVEVAQEEVELDCRAAGEPDALECALHVTWTLRNPTESAETPRVVLGWPREEAAELRVAGAPIAELPTVRPLTVIVPPGATTEIELRATLTLESELVGGTSGIPTPITAVDPLYARHPLLATQWVSARRGLRWARPDDLRFAAVGPTSVRVRAPDGWHPGSDLRSTDEPHVFRFASPEGQPAARYVVLELTRGSRGDFFRNGGPFLALGGTIDAGFRGRLGYEIGLDEFVLVSVSVDTDFERQVIVTPLVEVASWGMVIIPSLSLGLGVPIRVTDHAEHPSTAGVRIESSATFYSVAFVASLDVWPVDGSYALSLLGRIGL